MATIDLKTGGMHCSSCSMLIDMTVGDLPGVASAQSDYAKGKTRVEYDPTQISPDEIITAIEQAGYTARLAA